jgi:hypothetical protein
VKAGKPGWTVDRGHDGPVIGDDQDGVAGLVDYGGWNALCRQLGQAPPGDGDRRRARAGVVIPIEMGPDELYDLGLDSPLFAACYGMKSHATDAAYLIELTHVFSSSFGFRANIITSPTMKVHSKRLVICNIFVGRILVLIKP